MNKSRQVSVDPWAGTSMIGVMARLKSTTVAKRKGKSRSKKEAPPRPATDWRTSDEDEIHRRRERAREGSFRIENLLPEQAIFSNFAVSSGSGTRYEVEVRDVQRRQFSCQCVDFRINGLGTCKHVEAVLQHLAVKKRRLFKAAERDRSPLIDIVLDGSQKGIVAANGHGPLPASLRKWFSKDGKLLPDAVPEEVVAGLTRRPLRSVRLSQDLQPWLEVRRRDRERRELRREYEMKVQSGEWPPQETAVPLFPYQREGMLHLAFTERALLADEMGLGKTIQAIAACALLHRLGKARHVLIVTPASLKTEWEEQIQKFTRLSYQVIFGRREERLRSYACAPFFTIVNYEQMVLDVLHVNRTMQPDVVVLDEAQRIKNWNTKTAQTIKKLESRYAFVLTGTPIENRIDELHSLMDFLDPSILGPLFRFNRAYYVLDERGRPSGYKNLGELRQRVEPYLLRRRKADVETELPERTDRNYMVPLSAGQEEAYKYHEQIVSRLVHLAERRPLTKQEQDKLMREMAMMRMICDTNYILDSEDRECPKLKELARILEECRENGAKAIIFSEWERMLQLVRDLCREMGIRHAWHTGSVPQPKRRAEINLFKNDPDCLVFLSTDSGSTGLNLQVASVVVNCDLPWNPAKLEQRIGRAWRKHQTKPVTVLNLVSKNTIEERMLGTLADKKALADGLLDLDGDLDKIRISRGGQKFLEKLQILTTPSARRPDETPKPHLPVNRTAYFAQQAESLLKERLVRCEEQFPEEGSHCVLLAVVEGDAEQAKPKLQALHEEVFSRNNRDPLAPVQLQVIDRATHEALEQLLAAGLIQKTMRASRRLDGVGSAVSSGLTEEQLAAVKKWKELSAKQTKAAAMLATCELESAAANMLQEAVLAWAKGMAVENGLPAPDSASALLDPPYVFGLDAHFPKAKEYLQSPAVFCPALVAELQLRTSSAAVEES